MKNFDVTGTKSQLKAFQTLLDEKNIYNVRPDDDIDECTVIVVRVWSRGHKFGYFYSTDNLMNIKHFFLPQDWKEAVEYLDKFVNEQPADYKEGDWVVGKDRLKSNRVAKILRIDHTSTPGIKTDKWTTYGWEEIERHATQDEIKDELMSRTDLKVGDKVRAKDSTTPTITWTISKFNLVTKANYKEFSILVREYFEQNGVHLAASNKQETLISPVDKLEKVNEVDWTITTDNDQYRPIIRNGRVKIGCIELTPEELNVIKTFVTLLQNKEIGMEISDHGTIEKVTYSDEYSNQSIDLDDIDQLIELLNPNNYTSNSKDGIPDEKNLNPEYYGCNW